MTQVEQERMRAQTAFAVQEGKRWREEKANEFKTLPIGTVVAINAVSGFYVTAASDLEAMDKFQQAFGKGTTLAYVFEIGRPMFIGGGIA